MIRTIPRGVIRGITPNIRAVLISLIPIIVIIVLLVLFFQVSLPIHSEISKYYNDTGKKINVTLDYDELPHLKDTPTLLNITYSSNDTNNRLGVFDYSYLECHWTTDYGDFKNMNSISPHFENKQEEVTVSPCSLSGNIFWTYEVSDFGKKKPDVFIGLSIEDSNKDRIVGSDYLKLNWSDNDTIYIEKINEPNQTVVN